MYTSRYLSISWHNKKVSPISIKYYTHTWLRPAFKKFNKHFFSAQAKPSLGLWSIPFLIVVYKVGPQKARIQIVRFHYNAIKVVLLYLTLKIFTLRSVKIRSVKIFFIDFLDELGNFKQKNFYTSKCKKILHL